MSDPVSIRCVGDIKVNREDPASVMAEVMDLTHGADVMVGNLEGLVCDVGVPIQKYGYAQSKSCPPKNLEAVIAAGFHMLGVANNAAMNFGWEGLRQELSLLDEAGIQHAGGGADIVEAHKPAVVTVKGLRCALLSYTSIYFRGAFEAGKDNGGVATVQVDTSYETPSRYLEVPGLPSIVNTTVASADRDRVEDDIRRARADADIVMVAWHWGISGGYGKVVPYQVEMAHMAIDAGADIVLGHHPHQLQPLEIYRDRPICYSLGNFTMASLGDTSRHNEPTTVGVLARSGRLDLMRESIVLEVLAGKHGVESVRIHPIWIDHEARPTPLDLDDFRTASIIERLSNVENGSNVNFKAVLSEGCFEAIQAS